MVEYSPSNEPDASKRRSTRVVQAIPLTVTGVDALGQPFRERTSTLIVNCHGFKYQSKHYVLKGSWLDYEVPNSEAGKPPRKGRGQVTFVQRPRTAKELFQIGVGMEIVGNIWGIAFPPDDWVPYAEPDEHDILRPPARPVTEAYVPPTGTVGLPLHAVPPPTAPSAIAVDTVANLKQQVAQMLADAQEQIERIAREASVAAVSREANTLLRDLNIQMKVAAEKAVEQVSTEHTDEVVRKALKSFEEVQERSAQEFSAASARQFEKDLQESSRRELAKLTEAGETLRAEQAQRLSADLAATQRQVLEIENNLKGRLAELAVNAESMPDLVDSARKEIDAIAEEAKKQWSKRLSSYAESGLSRLSELDEAARKLQERIQGAAGAAQTGWQQKLEQNFAEAGARLENAQAAALQSAEQRLAENLEKTTASAVSKAAAELDQRAEEIRSQLKSATDETERRVASGQASLDEAVQKGKSSAAEIDAAAERARVESRQLQEHAQKAGAEVARQFETRLAEIRAQLDRRAESALAGLAQRLAEGREASAEMVLQFEATLAENRAQLDRHTDGVLASLTQRLEPALAERGAEMVTRLSADVEKQVAPRLHRAEETIQKLNDLETTAAQMLRREQERLQSEFAKSSQIVLARCMEELETKSTDATHETFEQLYKSAEWYQRKAQTAMQTAFDKGIAQAATQMREKAGEISTLFASELDHYSRSYSEHSQGLLEEAARDFTQKVREQFQESSEIRAEIFKDDIHRLAEDKAEHLRATSDDVMQEAQAGLAANVETTRRELDARSAQSTQQFQRILGERLQSGLNDAMQDFKQRLAPVMENWRAEARGHQEKWLESIERKGDESVVQFKHRLENASNAWLVAAVSNLNQQSQAALDSMAQSMEQRLRAICAEVFGGVGDTMRQRLVEFSSDLKKDSNKTPSDR